MHIYPPTHMYSSSSRFDRAHAATHLQPFDWTKASREDSANQTTRVEPCQTRGTDGSTANAAFPAGGQVKSNSIHLLIGQWAQRPFVPAVNRKKATAPRGDHMHAPDASFCRKQNPSFCCSAAAADFFWKDCGSTALSFKLGEEASSDYTLERNYIKPEKHEL